MNTDNTMATINDDFTLGTLIGFELKVVRPLGLDDDEWERYMQIMTEKLSTLKSKNLPLFFAAETK